MVLEKNAGLGNIGEILGFVAAYFFFTTMLFIILTTTKKIPISWSFFHIVGITILITSIGAILKRLLK